MRRLSNLPAVAAAGPTPAPDAPHVVLAPGRAVDSAEVTRALAKDHDRIAQDMTDVVVHRIFAAGLDLQAALGLIGDHPGTEKIYHAIDELDQAIRDIRDAIFDREPSDPQSLPRRGRP
jgi:signal transduction histidine kinase